MFFWRCREVCNVAAHQVEVDLAHASDAFERGQALRLCEMLFRELLNIGDLAAAGAFLGILACADPASLQAACSGGGLSGGLCNFALRMMGPAASASNGVVRRVIGRSATGTSACRRAPRPWCADIGSAWRTRRAVGSGCEHAGVGREQLVRWRSGFGSGCSRGRLWANAG